MKYMEQLKLTTFLFFFTIQVEFEKREKLVTLILIINVLYSSVIFTITKVANPKLF